MHKAGCSQVRVRIKQGLAGSHFNEFVRKADGLGRPITEVEVRNRYAPQTLLFKPHAGDLEKE